MLFSDDPAYFAELYYNSRELPEVTRLCDIDGYLYLDPDIPSDDLPDIFSVLAKDGVEEDGTVRYRFEMETEGTGRTGEESEEDAMDRFMAQMNIPCVVDIDCSASAICTDI